MFSLHLTCDPEDVDVLSAELWELGTVGIREEDRGAQVELIAAFEDQTDVSPFASCKPHWEQEEDTDWVLSTQEAWPARSVGKSIFLAPVWNTGQTPAGRVRVIHNPGLASGTGEHPCTQLALASLEDCISEGCAVVDVGTGSGILAVGARRLGARVAVALDLDLPSLSTARENFQLNEFHATVAQGSVDCAASGIAEVVVANISGTVLLSIADELLRVVKDGGWLILTGFPEGELSVIESAFGPGVVTEMNEWRCLTLRL